MAEVIEMNERRHSQSERARRSNSISITLSARPSLSQPDTPALRIREREKGNVIIATGPAGGLHDIAASTSSFHTAPLSPSTDNGPPVDTGFRAWTFCFSACALETFIFGWNNTNGVFQDYYTSHAPFNTASSIAVSAIGISSLSIQYIEIMLVISVCQRYPEYTKPAMWVALAICVIALVVSSFAKQIWQLVLLQGIIFALAAGILYAPIVMWLSEWFVARRGLAGGIIFGGSGVGGFVFPLALGAALDHLGFRWTLRIWALVLGVCCGLALLGSNPRLPVKKLRAEDRPAISWRPRNLMLLKNPLLLTLLATNIFQALSYFPVSLLISTYTTSFSTATTSASSNVSSNVALSLFNAASAVCYILFGRISDSYPYPLIILFSAAGSSLAAFLLWGYAMNLGMVFAFAVLFGGLSGGFPGTWAAAATELAGVNGSNEQTSLAFGAFSVIKGIAAIVGPFIAGALQDKKSSHRERYGSFGFRKVELFVGSMAAATTAAAFILTFLSKSKKKQQ